MFDSSGSHSNIELLHVARDVAAQKGLDFDIIISVIRDAVKAAGKKKYGTDKFFVDINRKTGAISLYKKIIVVNDDELLDIDEDKNEDAQDDHSVDYNDNEKSNKDNCLSIDDNLNTNNDEDANEEIECVSQRIGLTDAKRKYPNADIGDVFSESLPYIDVARVAAQLAKQVIVNMVRNAEREKQYHRYIDFADKMIDARVKRIENGSVILDYNDDEICMPKSQCAKTETYRRGDDLKVYVVSVERRNSGYQMTVSRTANQLVTKLLEREIPEMYDGTIRVKSVARSPGSRSKVAVFSENFGVNPVSACIGTRGIRIQNVVRELGGEKIDIINYSSDIETFIMNAIGLRDIARIFIDKENARAKIVVPDNKLSFVIGKGGHNVRLASELVGLHFDIVKESDSSKQRVNEFHDLVKRLVEILEVEEIVAQLLVAEGFKTAQDISKAPIERIAAIQGFDNEIAEELLKRASSYIGQHDEPQDENEKEDDRLSKELKEFLVGNNDIIEFLSCCDEIRTINDVAELSNLDMLHITKNKVDKNRINKIILDARKKAGWFE